MKSTKTSNKSFWKSLKLADKDINKILECLTKKLKDKELTRENIGKALTELEEEQRQRHKKERKQQMKKAIFSLVLMILCMVGIVELVASRIWSLP